jgi:hypothetical protein
MYLYTASEKRDYSGSSGHWQERSFSQQPYSSSLENLDPSAKEFLVDAGVILDKSAIQTKVSSSMPNLSKINVYIRSQNHRFVPKGCLCTHVFLVI